MDLIATVVLTISCIGFLYVAGRVLAIGFEEWFLGEPRAFRQNGDERFRASVNFAREYLTGRIFFYWFGTMLFWLTGNGAVSLLKSTVLSGSVSASATATLSAAVFVGATISTCLARVTAVVYDPAFMRALMYATFALLVSIVTATAFGGESLERVVRPLLPELESGHVAQVVFIASVCGFATEMMLSLRRFSWGRPPGSRVPVAGYVCISCGRQAKFAHENVLAAMEVEWAQRRRKYFAEALEAGVLPLQALTDADRRIDSQRARLEDALEAARSIAITFGGKRASAARGAHLEACASSGYPSCDYCGTEASAFQRKTGGWTR